MSTRELAEQAQRESEARLAFVLEAAQIGEWELDLESFEARRSLVHDRIFGYDVPPPVWSYDIFLYEHVHPEDRAEVDRAFQRTLATREDWDCECRIVRTDGELRWIWARGRFLGATGDRPARLLGLVQDITERKGAEEVLHRAAQRDAFRVELHDALRPLADSTAIQAEASRVLGEHLSVSRAHYAEVIENGAVGVVHADYHPGVPSVAGRYRFDDYGPMIMDVLRSGRTLVVDDVMHDERLTPEEKRATADLVIGAYVIVPLIKEGRPVALMAVQQSEARAWTPDEVALVEETAELTWATIERARAERELKRLNAQLERRVAERTAQLEESNKELEAFAYSVSHDLRAPLRGIDGFSQALLEDYRDRIDEEGRAYLQRIRAASSRMGILIDHLLDLSRLSRTRLKRQRVDLSATAHSVVEALRAGDPQRQVDVTIPEGLTAEGDADSLGIVLDNLLRNAWKFTQKQERASIEMGVTTENGERVFWVRDSGAGFDMRFADKLFTPFQRLHSPDDYQGTGIGLATVQRIVHRHGGRVWAEAEVGEGATFFFTLPGSGQQAGSVGGAGTS